LIRSRRKKRPDPDCLLLTLILSQLPVMEKERNIRRQSAWETDTF